MTPNHIAEICHEANRAYCNTIGDTSQVGWADTSSHNRGSSVAQVVFALANPDAKPSDQHDSWLAEKRATGWKYGPVKNPETKEHPCFVPYEELPEAQKAKDYLFKGVVDSLRPFVTA